MSFSFGFNFDKLSPDKVQGVIDALKDGKISDADAKALKLSSALQEEINKAFSSGELQIGDLVSVNKTGDPQTKIVEQKPSLWGKTKKFLKDNAGPIIGGVTLLAGVALTATGVGSVLGTTLIAKAAPTLGIGLMALGAGSLFTSCSKFEVNANQQMNVEFKANYDKISKLITELFTDLIINDNKNNEETNNKINQLFDILLGASDEIKNAILENKEQLFQLLEVLTQNNKLLKDLKEVVEGDNEAILNAILEVKSSVDVIADLITNLPEELKDSLKGDLNAIINAIQQGNMTLSEISQKVKDLSKKLNKILDQLKFNGKTQEEIRDLLNKIQNDQISDSEKLFAMLEILKSIDSTTQDINNKLDEINKNITEINNKVENDPAVQEALNKLLELVNENNNKADMTNQLLEKLLSMLNSNSITKEDVAAIINAINQNGDKIDATNQLLAKMQDQDEKFQAQVLKLLGNVGADYTDVLNKILDAVNNGNTKLTDITQLLAKMQNQDLEFQKTILNAINDMGTNITNVLNNILVNAGNDSAKLDQITQLLAKIDANIEKYGEDGKALGTKILTAINSIGADISDKLTQILDVMNQDKDTGKNIEALLNKVLTKMDSNTADIIEAIANIKIEGGGSGNVDLSSVEAMLKELIELTKQNNDAISNVGGKLDVLNITAQAILDKINAEAHKNDVRYEKVDAFMKEVLEKLESASGYDDTKLMEVLAKLSNMLDTRLEEILNAIKDHDVNVTVDVTGKVTCECNCGGSHEGILGDLEDALG